VTRRVAEHRCAVPLHDSRTIEPVSNTLVHAFLDVLDARFADRPVRGRGSDRCRSDGGSLPRARHPAGADGRNQGLDGHRPTPDRSPRARGPRHLSRQPSAHLRAPRHWTRARPCVPRDGVPRRGNARAAARSRRRSARPGTLHCDPDLRGSRRGSHGGRHSPRPQARQRDVDVERCQAARFRFGEAARGRTGPERAGIHAKRAPHRRRSSAGNLSIHGARASRPAGTSMDARIFLRSA
jgi:hypothetical protein